MRQEGHTVTAARHKGFTITAIDHLGVLVWQAARACFSRGWNNNLGWDNHAGWDNNT